MMAILREEINVAKNVKLKYVEMKLPIRVNNVMMEIHRKKTAVLLVYMKSAETNKSTGTNNVMMEI